MRSVPNFSPRAEAAFWRSAVWLPAEAARAADRPAGIGPADATLPIGMETALSMARLGAEVNACGGTPTKRASALSLFTATRTPIASRPGCRSRASRPGSRGGDQRQRCLVSCARRSFNDLKSLQGSRQRLTERSLQLHAGQGQTRQGGRLARGVGTSSHPLVSHPFFMALQDNLWVVASL